MLGTWIFDLDVAILVFSKIKIDELMEGYKDQF
jgi:hypothetical protein